MTSHLLTSERHVTDRTRIVGRLNDVANARVDIVAPQSALTLGDLGDVIVDTGAPIIHESGVFDFVRGGLTRTAFRHLAERLRIPLPYLDRLAKDNHADMVAFNVTQLAHRDDRTALYRFLQAEGRFTLRAVLSDSFAVMDDFDVFKAAVSGLANAGIGLGGCDVEADMTPDRFRLRIAVPQIAVAIPDLLDGYRPPFSMRAGADVHAPAGPGEVPPVMWAGLEVSNSETGGGAFTIAPRAVVLICKNGLTRPVDMLRKVHLGSKLETGTINWSEQTRRAALDLVMAKVTDAARTFCDAGYLAGLADEMRAARNKTLTSPTAAVKVLQNEVGFTDDETKRILDAFLLGGDPTVLGLGQAVTFIAAEAVESDRQSEMEASFWTIVGNVDRYAGATA